MGVPHSLRLGRKTKRHIGKSHTKECSILTGYQPFHGFFSHFFIHLFIFPLFLFFSVPSPLQFLLYIHPRLFYTWRYPVAVGLAHCIPPRFQISW